VAALPQGFLIRAAEPEDVPSVAALEARVFPDPWPVHLYAQEVRQALRFQRVVFNGDGYLAAYLFACWQADELHILKVATHPMYQGSGVASTLLADAAAEAHRGHGRGIILEVRPSNHRAVQLYRHLGYHVIGRRPRYYSDGEDAIVMFFAVSPAGPGPGI
jgi:ribosomal-protein-alanine N-acetyltransferase